MENLPSWVANQYPLRLDPAKPAIYIGRWKMEMVDNPPDDHLFLMSLNIKNGIWLDPLDLRPPWGLSLPICVNPENSCAIQCKTEGIASNHL